MMPWAITPRAASHFGREAPTCGLWPVLAEVRASRGRPQRESERGRGCDRERERESERERERERDHTESGEGARTWQPSCTTRRESASVERKASYFGRVSAHERLGATSVRASCTRVAYARMPRTCASCGALPRWVSKAAACAMSVLGAAHLDGGSASGGAPVHPRCSTAPDGRRRGSTR